jgi:ribosomal protein S28E/S33
MTTFTTQDRQDAQRTPLTDEEVWEVINRTAWVGTVEEIQFKIARAIERAHGIGE